MGSDDELITFVLPAGRSIAAPPTALQLQFKSAAGLELIGRAIYFNWAAIGWCEGKITRVNTDGRVKYKGDRVNFFAFYEMDDQEGTHCLSLQNYGGTDTDPSTRAGHWVLLDVAA